MDKVERMKMVSAMEYIARNLNDEEILEDWFVCGVADGDIEYGEMCDDEYYIEDDNFADLMDLFLNCMKRAKKSGGLYCDRILSRES